ncbi:MAG: molybdopterin-dependent oxidoreductase, partial [Deltaproteobacteria bacterium]|nr:molybdopterin-dependent oxidoreductase [Deltaproteobacteria bacterium]
MKIKRRDFLKVSSAAGLMTTVGCVQKSPNALSQDSSQKMIGPKPGEWKPTTCQGCTTWCPAEVFVQDGRAVKARGNQHSKQNDGKLCPRGNLSIQQVYDPDRIKVPMKRTNSSKGRGINPRFVPISWDEALNTIADKMMELRRDNESEKFCVLRGRYTYMRDTIYSHLPKIFGSPNGISHSAICAEAEKFGSYYTEGKWAYRDYDLDNSKYVLIWGCDPVSSNRMVPSAIKRLGDVLDKATVAVVDPKLNNSAAKAQEWMPVKPGTDGALAGAIAHELLVNGLWHKKFVGDFNDGMNRFKSGQTVDESSFSEKETHGVVKWWNLELKDRTPEWAAGITDVSAAQIRRVAHGLGKAAPNVAVWLGPGAAMHVRGAYSAMAVHALTGLLGAADSPGGVLQTAKIPMNKPPKYKKYQDATAKKHSKFKKIDRRGTKAYPAIAKGKSGGGVVTNNVADSILNNDPYDLKVVIGYMNNFVFSCTGAERWEKALAKIPFLVHLSTHASEFSQFADIVLPSTTNKYEKWGYVKTKANRYATCTLLQPVIEPLWDVVMDETEVPWLIAEKLKERGFSKLYDYFYNEYPDPETGAKPKNGLEFTINNLKIQTSQMWDGKKDVGGDKINGWNEFLKRGMWNSSAYKYHKRWGGKFKTKSKRFEFYSETLKAALGKHAKKHHAGIDEILEECNYTASGELAFVPHYEPPYRFGDVDEYPFDFIDYKSRLNAEGRSANCTWYHEFKHVDPGDVAGEDVIKINPVDASKFGLRTGDKVKVTSVVGSITCTVKAWDGIQPGTAAKAYGQG